MLITLIIFLSVSICFNIYCVYTMRSSKNKELSKDAKAVIRDLMAHDNAIIRVERIDPSSIMLRSPNGL